MNKRILLFGVAAVLLGGILSSCAGGNAGESGTSASIQPDPPLDAMIVVKGGAFVDDDFTVLVDSVELITDNTQSGLLSNDSKNILLYRVNLTVTYTGTEPITRGEVPFLVDDVESLLGDGPYSDDRNAPVATGQSFKTSSESFIDLRRESHAFEVVVWDGASKRYKVLGTIMLGPDSFS